MKTGPKLNLIKKIWGKRGLGGAGVILQLFLEMNANLTGLLLFNFESPSCKNHSDTNLVKIH